MSAPLPDEVVDDATARAVPVIVQTCANVLRGQHVGRWPTPCEVMAYLADVLNLDLDAPVPHPEAARWLAAGAVAPDATDDYGVEVFDEGLPDGLFRMVVPGRVVRDVEDYLRAQP